MPYCIRLLQADILPQKLSRRKAIDIFESCRASPAPAPAPSGRVAHGIRDGPLIAEVRQRDDDAVDLVPVLAKQIARSGALPHVFRPRHIWTLPASARSRRMPAPSSTFSISSRPSLARWPGKNPRLPTIIPSVICLPLICFLQLPFLLRRQLHAVDSPQDQQHPPHHSGACRRATAPAACARLTSS